MSGAGTPALEVKELEVTARERSGHERVLLGGVSFTLNEGEALAVVGESGSGKSLTSLAILGLLPSNLRIRSGQLLLHGEDLRALTDKQMRKVRGSKIGLVMQDPMASLDPSFTIRSQLAEPLRIHRGLRGSAITEAARNLLESVQIPRADERLRQFPHQLSGGMRQRVASAIALSADLRVLIADEPTTALDMTTQAQYLALLKQLRADRGFGLILITHDLYVASEMCSRVVVMYGGEVVEVGPIDNVMRNPQHPYTQGLLASVPTLGQKGRLASIGGQGLDSAEHDHVGCKFADRCEHVRDMCRDSTPPLDQVPGTSIEARCFGRGSDGWI